MKFWLRVCMYNQTTAPGYQGQGELYFFLTDTTDKPVNMHKEKKSYMEK